MPELMTHQVSGIEYLQTHPRALLADDPGLGKSVQALRAAVEPILVVAPAMILNGGVWDDETAKWAAGADVTQVAYSQLSGRERTAKGGSRPTGKLKTDYQQPWGTVILDEAHYVKGRKTSWTLATRQLKTERLIQLTGTPLPNWAHEAFTLLQLLYPEQAKPGGRLGSYWRWVETWFGLGVQYGAGGKVVSDHVIGDLLPTTTWDLFRENNWGDRMLRRLRADCLDLPPLTESIIMCDMKPAQAKAYRELKRDFITWLDNGFEVGTWSQAGQAVKLAQCATGLEILDPREQCSDKLDKLQNLLEDRPLPTLVVGHFQRTAEACAARAQAVGATTMVVHGGTSPANRRTAVRAFQAGSLDVLCATVGVISEGLTMTAADQIIRVERCYRPSRNSQARDRIYRTGQERPVTCIDLVTRGTIDENMLPLLAAKTDNQMRALGDKELRMLVV